MLERTGARLVHNRAGANMAGGVASALLDAAHGAGELDGDTRPVRGRRVLARRRWPTELRAARAAAGQPVPRPARPLRRARDDRRPLGRGGRRPARGHEARAQRRRPAGRRPRPPTRDAVVLRRRGRSLALPELQHASDSKHCRRCGHAYVYDAVYLGHLGRYHCPNCGAHRPEPQVVAARRRAATASARPRFALRTPAGRPRSSSPSPASTTSTTRSAPRRWGSRSTCRWTTSSPAWRRRARVRPRRGRPGRRRATS